MNPELQTLVDRLEIVERQSRSWKLTAFVALLLGAAALALPFARGAGVTPDRARFSVVEANRILLRDLNGSVAGGFESTADGTLRLVLGRRATASAHLVVHPDGVVEQTFLDPEGRVRAGWRSGPRASLWLSPDGAAATVALRTRDDGGGELQIRDADGRPRFRPP